ncbi:MAG: hypothetical protein FJY82_11675, partial [Candidatus Aminicenantes bacterium]|nr:hypothetical protein [Candidatus Aminicenantes bacterium]
MRRIRPAIITRFAIVAAFVSASLWAQQPGPAEILKSFTYRALGPARQCGRILHVAVDPRRPTTFYLAPSTGGIWKTTNNGTTFASVLPQESMVSVGHMALAPSNPDIVWVGSGDAASGRIPLRGFGVWKSTDAGKTWTHMGLTETRHIGQVAVHPRDPNTVYVAAVGYHFSFNPERGLYKTTDGGKTWAKVLFISDKVGVVNVVINPQNPDVVYAATYDKSRIPWNFDEGGPETGIYRTKDGGKKWKRLAGGLPTGKLARVGLAVYPKNPNIVYAVIDNQNRRPLFTDEAKPAQALPPDVKDRPVGGEVYRSDNGGDTWTKMNAAKDSIGGGKWYGWIYVDPNNDKTVYVPNVSMYRSLDGGKTWGQKGPENIAPSFHVDYHALWIDPKDSNHLIMGSDGGLAVSWDFAKTWDVFDHLPLAQYYAVGVDMETPYNIYGGLQDNGSVKIPSNGPSGRITRDDWKAVGGGDGMVNLVDPEDSRWLYNESQNGAIQRTDQKTGISRSIRPPARPKDKPPYRFNWTAPIAISPHNSRILYFGAQVVLQSLNRGDAWQEISPDLTTNDTEKLKGNIEFCTLTSIAESPVAAGVLWAGSDDGKVHVTRNGGPDWTDVTAALAAAGGPADYYVTRVFPSHFKEGGAYVSKSGWHRDVYKAYVFKTEDFGQSWTDISGNLPEGTVYVVVEDRKNPQLLFVGTEMGVFATLDGGGTWAPLGSNLPPYALVHDLLVHPRENDLVAATHGRGVFVTDITPLQEMKDKFWQEDVFLFEVEPKIQWTWRRSGIGQAQGDRIYEVPNEPNGLTINYFLKSKAAGPVKVRVSDPFGEDVTVLEGKGEAGLQ